MENIYRDAIVNQLNSYVTDDKVTDGKITYAEKIAERLVQLAFSPAYEPSENLQAFELIRSIIHLDA